MICPWLKGYVSVFRSKSLSSTLGTADQFFLGFKSFQVELSDFLRNYTADVSKRKSLQDIGQILSIHGLSCTALGLPDPGPIINTGIEFNNTFESEEAETRIKNLNDAQKYAFNTIINAVEKWR